MTLRQQLYKQHRLNGLSAYQAARKAGYRHATAISAHKNIESRLDFKDILVKLGIDDDKAGQVLKEGLEANKVISCNVIANDGEGMKPANEMTKDFVDVPDHATRHKFLETYFKLLGKLKPEGSGDRIQVVHMTQVNVNGQPQEFDLGDSA